MCCYREIKNFDRFIRLIHNIVLCTLQQLQEIQQEQHYVHGKKQGTSSNDGDDSNKKEKEKNVEEKSQSAESLRSKLHWTHQDREKLFHLLSKIFLLNFPLYIAMKHGGAINPLAPIKVKKHLKLDKMLQTCFILYYYVYTDYIIPRSF
jgi:hypothetical protein